MSMPTHDRRRLVVAALPQNLRRLGQAGDRSWLRNFPFDIVIKQSLIFFSLVSIRSEKRVQTKARALSEGSEVLVAITVKHAFS